MKDKIRAIEEYLKYFPTDRNAKDNLLMCEYADKLDTELTCGYYPRIEYGYFIINNQIKAGRKYCLTNSTTKYEQNGTDIIVIWHESCGRLAFVGEEYWTGIEDEWTWLKDTLKSYNPVDYDEINNNYLYNVENGKRLINEYDTILKTFNEKLSSKINDIETAKKRKKLEALKKELGE